MLFYQKGWSRKKSFTSDEVHAILYFRHAGKAISESANLKQAAVYRYPTPKSATFCYSSAHSIQNKQA